MESRILRACGLEPCDVVLTCVSVAACDGCTPGDADVLGKLKVGQHYRAKAVWDKGWYIPSVMPLEACDVCDGEFCGRFVLYTFCKPHFGELHEGDVDDEVREMIDRCLRLDPPEPPAVITPERVPEIAEVRVCFA